MATVEPKIKQIRLSDGDHDIDLPSTATPSITSITTSGNATIGGSISEGGTSLIDKYASISHTHNLSEITNRNQSLIDWGGPNITNSVSPLEVASIDDLGHNKFAFLSAASVAVQYSRDGGSTWVDYGATNDQKRALVTLTQSFNIGGRKGASNTVNDKLRVQLNSNNAGGNIYTNLRRILLYVSSSGSGGCTVKVEYRTIGNYRAGTDTWTEVGTYDVGGWSGWNSIPFSGAFGGSNDQTYQAAQIRLTFGVTSVSSTYENFSLIAIRGIGFPLWQSPSTIASTGHLYTFDISQNATFPANLSATSFTENGTALSSKYLSLSGGTLTNTTAPQLIIKNNDKGKSGIRFDRNGNTSWEEYIEGGNFYLKELNNNVIAFQLNEASQYSGNYNRPLAYGNKLAYLSDIPTVNNGTLKIQAEGTDLGTFTANQSGNSIINITAADLGLSGALKYRGVATTTAPSAGKYIQTVIGSITYYVSLTSSGTATQVNASLGDVITVGSKEYRCKIAGASGTNVFEELGDESSFALKSIKIEGTNGLTGGGTLESNRTLSLASAYGDTVNPYGSKTKNYVLAAPSGSNGTPSFRVLVASDIPDLSGTYLPLSGGTVTGNLTASTKIITGHIEAPSDGSNDTVSIDDRLAVSSTSNFNGDVFVGGWEQYTPQGATSPTWRPTVSQDSLRVNGTFIVNGEIDSLGHSVHAGDLDCDSLEVSGTLNCDGFNSHGASYVSGELYVTNQMTVTGNLNANNNVNVSSSLTVGGTLRANGDLKTNSVYPTDDNQRSLGKSDHRYKNGYIINTNTDKVILSSSATIQYNSTEDCIDFIFN